MVKTNTKMRKVVNNLAFTSGKAPSGQYIGRKSDLASFSSPIGAKYFAPMGLWWGVVLFIATNMSPPMGLSFDRVINNRFHNNEFLMRNISQ